MTTIEKGIQERGLGALLGQAAGDALGTTVEFKSAAAIQKMYPKGLRAIVGGGPFEVAAGQVTDDTELAHALARSLGEKGRYDATSREPLPLVPLGSLRRRQCPRRRSAARSRGARRRERWKRAGADHAGERLVMRISPLGSSDGPRPRELRSWPRGLAVSHRTRSARPPRRLHARIVTRPHWRDAPLSTRTPWPSPG
jgi:ADP-ribosylglycohydrolase